MNASLPVAVVDTHPSAVYRGQVYTQDAILALEDGPEFNVYDPNRHISPDMLQTRRPVELVVFIAVVTPSPVQELDVTFDDEERPVFRGRVVELSQTDDTSNGILDVGVGTIRFDPSESDGQIAIGDYLQITRGVIHVKDVEGRQEYAEEYYLDQLTEQNPEKRRMAARHLGTLGSEKGLEALIDVLHNDDEPVVRIEAATALGRIGMAARPPGVERDPRIVDCLQEAETDADETVVRFARLALEDIEKSDHDHMHSRDW